MFFYMPNSISAKVSDKKKSRIKSCGIWNMYVAIWKQWLLDLVNGFQVVTALEELIFFLCIKCYFKNVSDTMTSNLGIINLLK